MGRDGVTMCADMKATTILTWEYTTKIEPLGSNALIGSAGDKTYTQLLIRYLKDEFERRKEADYFDTVREAIRSYSKDIYHETEESGLVNERYAQSLGINVKLRYPEAILAIRDPNPDKSYRIFKIHPPDAPSELLHPHRRATAGQGQFAADILLKNTEGLLASVLRWWDNLPSSLIQKYCYVLMYRIAYVTDAIGVQAYQIGEAGPPTEVHPEDVFGKLSKGDHYARVLAEDAVQEIGPDKIAPLLQQYNFAALAKKFAPYLASEVSRLLQAEA